MKRAFDRVDMLVAAGLATGIALWAVIWAHPYPHPDLWSFLVLLKGKVSLTLLSVAGKVFLGLFAALAYLIMRASWMLHLDLEDEFPDEFFFTRFVPLCAAIALTCMPYVWRPAQYLSPGSALTFLVAVAILAWSFNRLFDGLTACFIAYFLFAFVAGMNPLGLLALGYVVVSDIVRNWQETLDHGQREADIMAFRDRSTIAYASTFAGVLGLAASVFVGALYFSHAFPTGGIIGIVLTWWQGWLDSFWPALTSEMFISMMIASLLVVASLALGRRIRATGPQGFIMAIVMSGAFAVVTVLMVLRAVDLPERRRLAMVGEYVGQTIADIGDARWFFTDGRFDDALRFELKRQGRGTLIFDALNAPSPNTAAEMRSYAPEPGDRDMFSAGGAEVFKAWARERPDRLAESAWQFGGGIVRRFGKVQQQTCGFVLKSVKEGDDGHLRGKSNRAFQKFSEELLVLLEHPVTHGIPFGSVDKTLASKCDAMLWRAARLAGERAEEYATAGNVNEAQRMRLLMQKLDGCNTSLRSQGNML